MEQFLAMLDKYSGKRILVLCHDDADSDALGAAWALARLVEGVTAVPNKISEHARELQHRLNIQVEFRPRPQEYDLTILVDTADSQQLPGCMPEQYLLVDHHPDNKLVDGAISSLYQQRDSTCQLVWGIYQARGKSLDRAAALALAAGIMGDTRYLATAANATLADLAAILEAGGVTYAALLDTLRVTGRIDREVRLQAALSGRLQQVGNCLVVATSAQRNYVYYVTMMLLELGADIALVAYQQRETCYFRVAKNPATARRLDVFSVLSAAVESLPRHNLWGNPDFAGFNGEADAKEVEQAFLVQLEKAQHVLGLCQCERPTKNTP